MTVSLMILLARSTVMPVSNIVFNWNLFCFARFWIVRKDERTDVHMDIMNKNNDHYKLWLWVGRVDQYVGNVSTYP